MSSLLNLSSNFIEISSVFLLIFSISSSILYQRAIWGLARTIFSNLPACGRTSYITGCPASWANSINNCTCFFTSKWSVFSMFSSFKFWLTSELLGKYAQPKSLSWNGIKYIVVLKIFLFKSPVGKIKICLIQSKNFPGVSA